MKVFRPVTFIVHWHQQKPSLAKSGKELMSQETLRLGVSQCLLGDAIRYDGGHKRDLFLMEVFAPFVKWIPVCPEVEAGLGTPREAMHLTGHPASPRLLTIHTKVDLTATLSTFSQHRVQELRVYDLDGYILKKNSPSCGMHRVKVVTNTGQFSYQGTGVFARTIQEIFPLLPIEEEGRLHDTLIRENFMERISGYRRWKTLLQVHRIRHNAIVNFHARHKYVLLTHSRAHFDRLETLVAKASHDTPSDFAKRYGELFMEALKVKATVKKHVSVLQQLARHVKRGLTTAEWSELQESIHEYHDRFIPISVPLTLLKHYIHTLAIPHLADQVYLNPFPEELK